MARVEGGLSRVSIGARLGIGVALVALVGVAYFVGFYGDLATDIEAAVRRQGELDGELKAARRAEQAYHKDLTELGERERRKREFNRVLPTTTEYPAFLSAVQNVANASGVGLTAWSPSPELPEEFYARVPMKLELVGRFHQIAKFLYGVGQLDRVINMENITLGEPKQDGEDVILKVEGLATAFRALEEAKAKPSGDKRGAARKKGGK